MQPLLGNCLNIEGQIQTSPTPTDRLSNWCFVPGSKSVHCIKWYIISICLALLSYFCQRASRLIGHRLRWRFFVPGTLVLIASLRVWQIWTGHKMNRVIMNREVLKRTIQCKKVCFGTFGIGQLCIGFSCIWTVWTGLFWVGTFCIRWLCIGTFWIAKFRMGNFCTGNPETDFFG